MSFWDLAQTAATIAAGVYGGPAAGAAVGGGLSALRGKDVITGAVTGYMGGMGGGGMNAAANQTALAAGTNVATVNAANAAASGLTGTTGMTALGGAGGFGSAAANTGINALPTGMNTGLQNVTNRVTGSGFQPQNMTNTGPQFGGVRGMRAGVDFPNNTIQPTADFGGGGGYDVTNSQATYDRFGSPDGGFEQIDTTTFADKYNPSNNTPLQNSEIGADYSKPNTKFAKGERYAQLDQSKQMPVEGYSLSEKWDAVSNNPREFMKNLGDGNELYGAGKLGLSGIGMYASAIEPENGYGNNYDSPLTDNRFRGPQGQLNLAGLSTLNVNNPYGYAEGGYLSGGNVPGDGMSDSIPAMIGREQQAALSEGEFVVPADVVSHLGNGSSNAGSKRLYEMMAQLRKARTGTEKQGKEINPERYIPA